MNEIDFLNQIISMQSQLAQANFDLDSFLDLIVHQVEQMTHATGVVVELVNGTDMIYRAALGTVSQHLGLRLPIENSISGLCVKNKKILWSNDTENDPRVNLEACHKVKARSLIVAPLFHNGEAVGVIKIISNEPNAFEENVIKTLHIMAGLTASGLAHQIYHDRTIMLLKERTMALEELRVSEEKLKHLANYDSLTNLPNRNLFNDRLSMAMALAKRYHTQFAIFFIDIDHFKKINDTFGHAEGDKLLTEFAIRLASTIRESDTCSRFGGDEFVILLNEIHHENDAICVAEKILESMKKPILLHQPLLIFASIGISFYRDGISSEELLIEADSALYEAKQAGRNQYKMAKIRPQ